MSLQLCRALMGLGREVQARGAMPHTKHTEWRIQAWAFCECSVFGPRPAWPSATFGPHVSGRGRGSGDLSPRPRRGGAPSRTGPEWGSLPVPTSVVVGDSGQGAAAGRRDRVPPYRVRAGCGAGRLKRGVPHQGRQAGLNRAPPAPVWPCPAGLCGLGRVAWRGASSG